MARATRSLRVGIGGKTNFTCSWREFTHPNADTRTMDDVEGPAVAFMFTASQDRREVGLVCRVPDDDHAGSGGALIAQREEDDAIARRWVLHFYEFLDDGQFSNLESLLVRVGASKCFYNASGASPGDKRTLGNMFESLGMDVESDCRRGEFGTGTIKQDLTRLLGVPSLSKFPDETAKPLCMGAAACLIKRLDLMSSDQHMGNCDLVSRHLSQFLRLDAAATRALNLLPPGGKRAHKNASLLGLLDHCKVRTAPGGVRVRTATGWCGVRGCVSCVRVCAWCAVCTRKGGY